MVAGLFQGAGYWLGPNLLPPRPGNPRGIFESRDINLANEELMRSVVQVRPEGLRGQIRHRRWLAASQLWLASPAIGAQIARPSERLAERMSAWTSNPPFAFKDPRFSFTLGSWREWLGSRCTFVVVFREPGRTADSIVRECRQEPYLRNLRMTLERALAVWTCSYDWILRTHAGEGEWVFVHYDEVIHGGGIDRLEAAIGAVLSRTFADASLSRAKGETSLLPGRTRATYGELCRRAGIRS
jgi:hypothetical protein